MWFQLRIVGVTAITAWLRPGFFYRQAQPGRAFSSLLTGRLPKCLKSCSSKTPQKQQPARHVAPTTVRP
jgi:hypothetical protein